MAEDLIGDGNQVGKIGEMNQQRGGEKRGGKERDVEERGGDKGRWGVDNWWEVKFGLKKEDKGAKFSESKTKNYFNKSKKAAPCFKTVCKTEKRIFPSFISFVISSK